MNSNRDADMMKLHFSTCGVVLSAEHVFMMRGLLKEYCESQQCHRQSSEAENAARDLLSWYRAGVTDQERLRQLLAVRTVLKS